MRKHKEPTATHEVEEALRAADDMLTPAELARRTGKNMNQVWAALSSLQHYKVVDFIANSKGDRTHWYALPAEMDTRISKRKERVPEVNKRKPRKQKAKEIR